jgi:flagellar assembly protein FliH
MKGIDPILRDVSLHSEARRLHRPAKAGNRVAPATTDRDAATKQEGPPWQEPAIEAGLVPAAEKNMSLPPSAGLDEEEAKRRIEEARNFGYQQGMREGVAKLQRDVEGQAVQLAKELAEERVREATVSAERKALEVTEQLKAELMVQRGACARLMRSVSSEIVQRLKETEDDILVLAFAMVCKMLGTSAVTEAGLRLQIKQALQNWHLSSAPVVHLHPDDVAWIQAEAGWVSALEGVAADSMGAVPRLVPDAGVNVGGCILRSADGELDARLDMQIEAMKAALVETRKRRVLGSSEAGEGARE